LGAFNNSEIHWILDTYHSCFLVIIYSMSFPEPQILPNFGRPSGHFSPVSLDHIFKDTDEPKDVLLQVTLAPTGIARHNHWTICWVVGWSDGYAIQRRVHIVQELQVPHLTNWGPLTKSASADTASTSRAIVLVPRMSLEDRKRLEKIGSDMPVLAPNGEWNCQDWVILVLVEAESQGLISRELWKRVIEEAQAGFDE
jgi:hypothetical protein